MTSEEAEVIHLAAQLYERGGKLPEEAINLAMYFVEETRRRLREKQPEAVAPGPFPNLVLRISVRNEVNRAAMPSLLENIAAKIADGHGSTETTYPVRDADGLVIGSWIWGYEGK